MEDLKDVIKRVKDNYRKLPKSIDDAGEFVIIAEKDEGGGYEAYKECLGVRKNGKLIWSYLSGCSCGGSNRRCEGDDITVKTFEVGDESYESLQDFYDKNKCEPYEANYESY